MTKHATLTTGTKLGGVCYTSEDSQIMCSNVEILQGIGMALVQGMSEKDSTLFPQRSRVCSQGKQELSERCKTLRRQETWDRFGGAAVGKRSRI